MTRLTETELAVVSDVDSHSQCGMRVTVKDGRVVAIRGNPDDPECEGALTLRDQHLLEMLYAPDRLQYPLKRVEQITRVPADTIHWSSR